MVTIKLMSRMEFSINMKRLLAIVIKATEPLSTDIADVGTYIRYNSFMFEVQRRIWPKTRTSF